MKRLLVILLILFAIHLQAQVKIREAEAHSTAEQFVSQQNKQDKQTLTLSEEIKSKQSGQTNLFVFSMQPQGFIIVSALNEVLAYSFESSIPAMDELPDHIAYWLNLYNEQTDYLLQHPDQITKPTKQQRSVGPLVTSIWGQGCYHNQACPEDELGPCRHVSAGCVAIAIAQIMYYNKQPIKGIGSMTYSCPPYGTLSADFNSTTYQWDDMVDTVNQYNAAVAKLISHCGISVKMVYGPQSSSSSNVAAHNALRQFFLYPCSTISYRNSFSDEAWLALIRQDIDNRHPVYYEGKSYLGTHAFVCDGYDTNGLFHFNFGWDGVADGYYTLDSPYGFSIHQSCIHNIIPADDFPIQSDSHGIIYVTPDENGDGSSWENATNDLQAAIFKSHVIRSTIWVKEGLYTNEPMEGYAYNLLGDCRLYGGFKGDEPYDYDLSLRDFEAHPSILDGNQSYGVINVQIAVNPVFIDGFTIQNGRASQGSGISVKCQTLIDNCKFRFNYSTLNGGGFSNLSPRNSEKVILKDCEFFGNEAKFNGGAVYDLGNTKYHRCHFHDNLSRRDGGGAYCNSFVQPSLFYNCTINNNVAKNGGGLATIKEGATFWNCLINNNTAETGGACYLEDGSKLYNCTIVKNEAQTDYGGVYVESSSPQDRIRNCIIWGNVSPGENTQIGPEGTYSYCAVEEDQLEAGQNFKAEDDNDGGLPRFYVRFQNADVDAGVSGQGGDWRLQPNSLCINRGISIVGQSETDLDGNPRCLHEIVDLGAYESNTAVNFINAYFCENTPFYYQGSLLSELGIYSFLICGTSYDSLVVINLKNPPPAVIFNEKICEDNPYDFFGTLLYTSGTYTTTIDCITYQLNLTVQPLTLIPMEAEICEGDTYNFFGTPLIEAGVYADTSNCQIHQLDLSVIPLSETDYSEKTICEGETYNFHGLKLQLEGHYRTMVNCKPYELDLTVNPVPKLQCSSDTIIDYGSPAHLSASGADSYLWSTGDTTDRITVFPKEDKLYSVEGFSQNGCSKKRYISVKVNDGIAEMVLFPNPAYDKVLINIPFMDEVDVFNLLGEHIYHVDANREAVNLDVSPFDNGIYIIQVRQLKNIYYEKLIVLH